MSDTETVLFMVGYVAAAILFPIAFYFVWFRGDCYQSFMNRLFYKGYFSKLFGSYTKTKQYLRDQRIVITGGLLLVIAIGLAAVLKR